MSVMECISESIKFIEASGFMPEAIANSSQIIIATIESLRGVSSMNDCTEALQLLNSNLASKAFPSEIRQSIIDIIVKSVSESSESKVDTCTRTTGVSTVQQNRHIENYFTREDWDEIDRFHKGLINVEQLMRRIAVRSGAIRMWNPTESVGVRIAAIVAIEMESMPAEHTLYDWARSYKEWLVRLRNRRGIIAGPSVYPEDAITFAALNPGTYDNNRPPVECRVAKHKIDCAVMHSANRISSESECKPASIASSVIAPVRCKTVSQSTSTLRELVPRQQQSDRVHIGFAPSPKRTKIDCRLSVMENGSPDACHTLVTIGKPEQTCIGERTDFGTSDIEAEDEPYIESLIKCTSTAIDKATKPKEQSNATKSAIEQKIDNRMHSNRKSVIECKTCPSMPSVTADIGSIMWKGCKIQSNLNKRTWRVFPKPGEYAYDKGFPWGADPTAAWNAVIAYCDNPIFPRGTEHRT